MYRVISLKKSSFAGVFTSASKRAYKLGERFIAPGPPPAYTHLKSQHAFQLKSLKPNQAKPGSERRPTPPLTSAQPCRSASVELPTTFMTRQDSWKIGVSEPSIVIASRAPKIFFAVAFKMAPTSVSVPSFLSLSLSLIITLSAYIYWYRCKYFFLCSFHPMFI